MELSEVTVSQILTRTSGYLKSVCSHSLQPYCGCALGNSLCGIGCYVQHNAYLTRGRAWGSFVEARVNASDVYRRQYDAERRWARARRGSFGIFLSSSTEPFQPVERKLRVTHRVLEAMVDRPPDFLIVQSHSHHVADPVDLYRALARTCDVRLHVSIESDRDALPGLPPSASPVEKRLAACATLRSAGLKVVVTVAPLLPIGDPERFFRRLSSVADRVVIDHFIGGDGSRQGSRTRRTPLPLAMQQIDPASVTLEYRDRIVEIARRYFPGRVGVGCDGFAGRTLESAAVSQTIA